MRKRRQGAAFFPGACKRHLYEACTRPVRSLSEKHFYFKMLVTFEPNVAQRSVASQNDHKSKACLPEASHTASTMYRYLKRRLRRLYEAPFLATFFLAPHSSNWGCLFLHERYRTIVLFNYSKKYTCAIPFMEEQAAPIKQSKAKKSFFEYSSKKVLF